MKTGEATCDPNIDSFDRKPPHASGCFEARQSSTQGQPLCFYTGVGNPP